MSTFRELRHQTFGKLFVINRVTNTKCKDNKPRFICRCTCGTLKIVASSDLTRGHISSCGNRPCHLLHKHGHSGCLKLKQPPSKTYAIWVAMKKRCINPGTTGYSNYGGRGITVCEEWKNFETFLNDMGEAPKGLSLDRIDNEKGYSRENCRWTTREQQANNTRRNRFITFNNSTKSFSQWSREVGISVTALRRRILGGWSIEKALSLPKQLKLGPGRKFLSG